MLDEPTYERLISMRLRGLADAWRAQQQDPELGRLTSLRRLDETLAARKPVLRWTPDGAAPRQG